MDEVALSLGKDPADYRLYPADNPRAKNVIEKVMKMPDWGTSKPGRAQGIAYSDYNGSYSASLADISLDEKAGKITVHRYFIAVDAGLSLIPDNARAQVESGVFYGISSALTERVSHSEGMVQQSNFHD